MEESIDKRIFPRSVKYYIDRKMTPLLDELDLNTSCGQFLLMINEKEGYTLSEFSSDLRMDKALVTRMTKKLLEDGFVEDRNAESRGYSLYLTEKGRTAEGLIRRRLSEVWKYLMGDFTDEERSAFASICRKVNDRMRNDTEGNE